MQPGIFQPGTELFSNRRFAGDIMYERLLVDNATGDYWGDYKIWMWPLPEQSAVPEPEACLIEKFLTKGPLHFMFGYATISLINFA